MNHLIFNSSECQVAIKKINDILDAIPINILFIHIISHGRRNNILPQVLSQFILSFLCRNLIKVHHELFHI